MPIKIIVWLGVSIAGAVLYRLGGTKKGTLWRDLGVSLLMVGYMLVLGIKAPWWAYLLAFGLSWGALSAYWGLDAKKYGFWLHGLGISLAVLPIIYFTGHWLGFGIRTILLTTLITFWGDWLGAVYWEEGGRGFFTICTLPMLLL